jgi:hypothetical protein
VPACAACGAAVTLAMSTGHSARQVFDLPEPTPLAATVRSKKPDFAVGLLRYYLLIK